MSAMLHRLNLKGGILGLGLRGESLWCAQIKTTSGRPYSIMQSNHAHSKRTLYTYSIKIYTTCDHDETLSPNVVRVQPLSNDDILSNSCMLSQKAEHLPGSPKWGRLSLSLNADVSTRNILKVADQARDFTLAHRLTWRVPRAYRETDDSTWVDIEFICTATWAFGLKVLWVDDVFACRQDRPNFLEEQQRDIKDADIERIERGEAKYMNEEGKWGMQKIDIWSLGLR
ncbi:hypothetical protein BC937DRAFT_88229 [Endogone sp. FLAS-F59071]|nr:hypothetical protein BC937DRAFT_88229 [Endogone sp. FLAS-F59071]|eukprot:RUS22623.1 hypothetical protein BC937DRAFT_88229 [Endogone sp. FLAS-F59071]